MKKLIKYCILEKGVNIDKHIEEYKGLYPTEFIIRYRDDFEWELHKNRNKYYLKNTYLEKVSKEIKEEFGNYVDIVAFFLDDEWKQTENRLYGFAMGGLFNGYPMTATRCDRRKYYGTAEHEDLHVLDDYIKRYTGITLEKVFNVDNFDIDIVHRDNIDFRLKYNYDDVWDIIKSYLNTAISVKKNIVVETEFKDMYKPKNFELKELVSPYIYSQYGNTAWQFFDERLLRNLQWLRERFGVTYVNIKGTFNYRGFDAYEYRKSGISQHNHGRAIDCHFKNYTIKQVHNILRKEYHKMPYPDIWIEEYENGKLLTWLHIDIRFSNKKGIHFFNT